MPRPRVDIIFLDEHTQKALGAYRTHRGTKKLIVAGKKPNINNDIDLIESILGKKIQPLVMDLYNIALTVYMSDLLIKRPSKTRGRSISILISVSDKSKWDASKDDLVGTLRFLSGDNFAFHFIQGEPSKRFEFDEKNDRAVSLFSGGLDSFAGVKWLLDKGLKPILVSHCGQNQICAIQSSLAEKVNLTCGQDLLLCQISARARFGGDRRAKELTQRSRSFLYLSLGTLVSLEMGINRLFVFENGVLAINIPITQARIFGNTRTTHPDFLARYNDLIRKIFSVEFKIENPFLYMTKGEVATILDFPGFRELIKQTITCSHLGLLRAKGVKTKHIKHCGVCLPCTLRRTALNQANLVSNDAKYYQDINGPIDDLSDEGRMLLYELKNFGRSFSAHKSDEEVLLEYPYFYIENADISALIAMYRRYITELDAFLS